MPGSRQDMLFMKPGRHHVVILCFREESRISLCREGYEASLDDACPEPATELSLLSE
jgi:hypothetical protein